MEQDRSQNQLQQQPQTPLMCPRCSSRNTKFRYYNNHSLSQPRHYCRDCKRQWTVGGSLRAIPVGGTTRIKQTDAMGSKCGCSRSQPQPLQLPSGVAMPHFQEPIAPLNSFHFGNEFPKLDAMDSLIEPKVGFGSSDTNSLHDWNVESLAPKQVFSQQVVGSYNLHADLVQPTWRMEFAHQEAIDDSSFSRTNVDLPSSSVNTTQWSEFPSYGASYK